MKNLLYKELRLAMHPVCYIFTFAFPLMVLIPNQPAFVCTLYIVPIMSILFLGANKGKQSNDLFYTALLPVRKKDIVKGRMASVMFMEFGTLITASLLLPFKMMIEKAMPVIPGSDNPGMGSIAFVSTISFGILGYAIANAFFFLMFYKSGRSVTAPTLCATFTYVPFVLIFTCILPATVPGYNNFFYPQGKLWLQFIYLISALIIFAVANFLIYKKASKELERADL